MSDNSTGATDNGIDTVEPSMEDILASIRRIIADDEVQKPEVSEVASEVQQDTNLPPELPQASDQLIMLLMAYLMIILQNRVWK